MYKAVKVVKGNGGWGGPLVIHPTEKKNKIVSITGGGIDPISRKIAKLTGAKAVDGFSSGVSDDEIACVIINCGGTLRCGVYPKKEILTINITPVGQSGPLAQYIVEELYVSGVLESGVTLADESEVAVVAEVESEEVIVVEEEVEEYTPEDNWVARGGKALAGFATTCVQGGKEAVDITIKDILPFMAFYALLLGIITYTGLAGLMAEFVYPYLGTLPGLLVLVVICALPMISPLVGSGALIGQVLSVLVGLGIALGAFPVYLALPAFFAVDAQVGCDFIPVGLSMGDAENETVDIGVPSILLSRLFTGPIAVVIAYFFAMFMYGMI